MNEYNDHTNVLSPPPPPSLTARHSQLQEQYTETVASIQEQKLLITQLEEDLRSVNALSAMFRGDAEVPTKI